ncbi:uncharacterized protein LOC103568369 [Microplitis demolitor]|uniref:uncharacterized protein LOC103568369 n=1 Tax=Microplitis demolitor TaxID=69319 RepID=UPI0004CCADDA|nr:uncharacterized protein LOC103568369 [Microplitis demolitor]
MDISKIFSKNRGVKNQNFKWNFSYIGSCYNILLFIGFSSLSLYKLFGKKLVNAFSNSVSASVILGFLYLTLLSTSLLPLIYVSRQKLLISVNDRIKNVDEILNKCVSYEMENDYTNNLIFIGCFFTSTCVVIMSLYYFPSISVFFENIPAFISGAVIIQYVQLLIQVKKRFESINSTISRLAYLLSNESRTEVSYVTQNLPSRESIFNDINNLKYAYMVLWKICQDITDFYGIPILIGIFCFGVKTIANVYITILSALGILDIDIKWYLNGTRMSWTISLFIALTSNVTTVMNQLSKFSSDLWYLKIKISACDIIPIDRTLLSIITGTMATYLIISVQFAVNSPTN